MFIPFHATGTENLNTVVLFLNFKKYFENIEIVSVEQKKVLKHFKSIFLR